MLSNVAHREIIYQSIEEGVVVVNEAGIIVWVNFSLEKMFGYSNGELIGEPLEKLVPLAHRKQHVDYRMSFIENPLKRSMHNNIEFEGLTKDGKSIWLRIGLSAYQENGEVFSIASITNITEKRIAEIGMKKYVDRAKLFLKLSKTIFIELDRNGNIKLINPEGCHLLKTTEEEALGKNWFDTFIAEKDKYKIYGVFRDLIDGKSDTSKLVNSAILTNSGHEKMIQWHNTAVKDENGETIGTLSSGIDITEHEALKKVQTDVILMATEKERKRVAMELHDGIIQILSAVSMNLKSLEDSIQMLPKTNQRAYYEALSLLIESITEVRAISHDLMPSVILNHGLEIALLDLVKRTQKTSGMEVYFDSDHINESLDQMQAVNIYRIIQELIQNTIKHAKASSIKLKIRKRNETMEIKLQDDGRGFDPILELEHSSGMGYQNIKARVDSMDGVLNIASSPTIGTTIRVTVHVND